MLPEKSVPDGTTKKSSPLRRAPPPVYLPSAVPFYLLIPLAAALVYTVGSLYCKQASDQGLRSDTAFHLFNMAGAVLYLPLFAVPHDALTLGSLWRCAVIAVLVFLGNRGTFAAIRLGDVSLITPIMGTKVILVAAAAVAFSGAALPPGMWVAAGLTTLGILVMGSRDLASAGANRRAILLVLGCSVMYAAADALISLWAPGHGGLAFLALLPLLVGMASGLFVLRDPSVLAVPAAARAPLWKGCFYLNAQGLAFGLALALFHDPAGANVVYGTRGLFSIAAVWFAGKWFANRERDTAGHSMITRLTGALMITAAVVVAVWSKSN